MPDIQFFDSKDDQTKTWLFIDDCPVRLDKKDLKNWSKIIKEINRVCHMDLDEKASS